MRPEALFLPRNPSQWEVRRSYPSSTILFLVGPAGTGKTHAALGCALEDLFRERMKKLLFVRPLIPCGGESVGFLRGGLAQKLEPWLASAADVLPNLTHAKLTALVSTGKIEQTSLGFMRGRTVGDRTVCVLDEAQNLNMVQMRMFLSRIGDGGKIIITGDPEQSDLSREILSPTVSVLEGLPGVGVVRFDASQTVRHPLIPEILTRLRGH